MEKGSEMQNNHIDIGSGPEDQMLERLASANLQDRDALVQECQDTGQIEVAASEVVATMPAHSEAQTIENFEPLHLLSTDVYPSCNQSPATEVEHQNHGSVTNSSQAAQCVEASAFLDESSARIERDSKRQSNCPDSSAGLSTPSRNNVAMSQVAARTPEVANGSALQVENNSSNTVFLIADPFESEWREHCKEREHWAESCKDEVARLKSEYEKEIQEVIAQARSKHEKIFNGAEADFRLKMQYRQEIQKKALENKVLANVLRAQTALQSYDFPSMQQGATAGLWQQRHQQLIKQLLQLTPQSSTLHKGQHLSVPQSTGHVTCPNIAGPVQAIQCAVTPPSTFPISGPQVMNAVNISSGNLHLLKEIHSSAPHLRAFRPAAASYMHPAASLAISPALHSLQQIFATFTSSATARISLSEPHRPWR